MNDRDPAPLHPRAHNDAVLCSLSALELARRLRARAVRAERVVEAHVRRIERVNPELNALVAARFDAAREEARAADARLDAGLASERDAPLLGVPCTIKECFALEGMPNTSGLVARKGLRAAGDAVAVARLRAAGAIPLGVSNVSELCMWMESGNYVYGRTASAYDPTRTAGGSSGGEGALVGAGASPFGLGADVGGSIRMPAFFNGVFGHKPSPGLVPNDGQFPNASEGSQRMLATGPLARRAEDLYPLVQLLAGRGFDDEAPRRVDPRAVRLLLVEDPGPVAPSADVRRGVERAAEALARLGARVERVRIPALRRGLELWSAALATAGGPSFASLLAQGGAFDLPRELARYALRRSPHTFPALGLAVLERVAGRVEHGAALALLDEVRADLHARLDERTALLFPPHPVVAPRHGASLLLPIRWAYTALFNALEVPVTQAPTGFDAAGLPLGVQLVGGPGHDALTIGLALHLEASLGGWRPPPRFAAQRARAGS